jgi:nitrilase
MLICWESYMPLARYALYAQGLDVLLLPTYDEGETYQCTVRHIAKEGRVYVVSSSMVLHRDHIPSSHGFHEMLGDRQWIKDGDSSIAAPSGALVAGPLNRKSGILYADVDPAAVTGARWNLDVAGHYARPDIFHFDLKKRGLRPMGGGSDESER